MISVLEDKQWVHDVMHTIQHRNNDVAPSIINRLVRIKHNATDNNHDHLSTTSTQTLSIPTIHLLQHNTTPNEYENTYTSTFNKWTQHDSFWIPPKPNIQNNSNASIKQLSSSQIQQSDSGANRVVTDDITILHDVTFIPDYPMGGCNKDDVAIICTAIGYMNIYDMDNKPLRIKAYFSKDVDGTIVSPTAIVRQHNNIFNGWNQYSDCENNTGYIAILGRDKNPTMKFALTCINDLWYHTKPLNNTTQQAKIKRINAAATYELWHQRTGHIGQQTLNSLHKHVDGVPKLHGNSLHTCLSCLKGKLTTKRSIGKQKLPTKKPKVNIPVSSNLPDILPGQQFHLDFGFVKSRTSTSTSKSIDGYNSYLLAIDKATRYTWIFLSKSKSPPIETTRNLLQKFKSDNPHRIVRTDQGGELARSHEFSKMIAECGFVLEQTGPDASAQNGIAERPNLTFANMMRCILYSSELGEEYWSHALLHAVYLKNRLPHSAIGCTPYEKLTGIRPDLSHLRIFGCTVSVRQPGKRQHKLAENTTTGTFLGYTATGKNIHYIDNATGTIKTGTHVIFDETNMSLAPDKIPHAAQVLQHLGYHNNMNETTNEDAKVTSDNLNIDLMHDKAIKPTKATENSIGYDLYHCLQDSIELPAGSTKVIPTGIKMTCPHGTYGRIAPRSGLTIKQNITTMAGVIDPDYRGEVKIVLHNFGKSDQIIEPKTKIAQLILETAQTPSLIITNITDTTERGQNGFGSSDAQQLPMSTKPYDKLQPYSTTFNYPSHTNSTTAAAATCHDNNIPTLHTLLTHQIQLEQQFDLHLTGEPYDNKTSRIIKPKSYDDNTLGLIMQQCPTRGLPQLINCKKGSSSIRIPKWRSELRNAYITHVNNIPTYTINQIKNYIQAFRKSNPTDNIKISFATIHKQSMHPQFGVPQLYHDQLNIIGSHLWDIRNNPEWNKDHNTKVIYPEVQEKAKIATTTKILKKRPKKLTRRWLLQQHDWTDWRDSEFKQLNHYYDQKTFSEPCQLPPGANVLPLLWTYLVKDCGTKKARCVCNGSPRMQGTVTLGETYAKSLEQTGSRLFWATSALYNFIVIGADASNAFAEAPAPKAPLYVIIDKQYREWWKHKFPDKPPIPPNSVLKVNGALQGHPESARLWAILIDKVIRDLKIKPTTHEPCLYYTDNYNNKNKKILFLRQVDDFAVGCEDVETAQHVISNINNKMTISVKDLGQLTRFNGVDILQTRHYIKLYNTTYINKITAKYVWIKEADQQQIFPIPMHHDPKYQRKLETAVPSTPTELKHLEKEYNFTYRQGVGELIYAMVTCRPDISYATIKLSQYSTKPSSIHFEALKQIYLYITATKNEGIHYWRIQPRQDLPIIKQCDIKIDETYDESTKITRHVIEPRTMNAAVDSDFAGDQSHRRSVTGISLQLAGATVLYKTKFQDVVAQSSTEAEFIAAAEAAKFILYVRSIMDEIGIPQQYATTLYEDNRGAMHMANSQQPTKRTRHMDIKHFAIQDWCQQDLLKLAAINTTDNWSDAMTKAQGRVLFHRHMNHILGRNTPKYANGI
jgi:dUTP pyrophosphatase